MQATYFVIKKFVRGSWISLKIVDILIGKIP